MSAVAIDRTEEEARLLLEIQRRKAARESLVEYARFIEIPGAKQQVVNDDAIAWISDACTCEDKGTCASCLKWNDVAGHPVAWQSVETQLVRHHVVILEELQRCMETPNGRLMILAPPGSAKSTYAIVVGCTWAMGKWPGYRLIVTSYATRLARKQSRKALQVTKSLGYRSLWKERPEVNPKLGGAEEWQLTNGSELMAAGILAGITGNRANGAVCDDLIAGREEAESPTIRSKTMDAYRDDVESRMLPNGWICLINTRWHMEDPSGAVLPDDYAGQSGDVLCKDGRTWRVLNIPARAEHADDPIGRQVGDYLWPEWFPKEHWQGFENDPTGQRRWASLYQGRPTGDVGDDFKREDAQWYDDKDLPKRLTYYAASDFAVKDPELDLKAANRVDWTEHGVVGMDETGDLWFVDWWSGQRDTEASIDAMLDRVPPFRPVRWWDEGGVIDTAIRPAVRRRMRERSEEKGPKGVQVNHYVKLESLTRIADKRAKCQSFAARYSARTTHWPRSKPWAHAVIDQLVNHGSHRYDDKYDVCGLLGRGIDKMMEAPKETPPRERGPKAFTGPWVEYEEPKPGPRYR